MTSGGREGRATAPLSPLERAERVRDYFEDEHWHARDELVPVGSTILTPDEAEKVRDGLFELSEDGPCFHEALALLAGKGQT